jgi:branched-chain amino acid transport system permease protein
MGSAGLQNITPFSKKMPQLKTAILIIMSLVAIATVPKILPGSYTMQLINQALIYCILVLGLNFITGFTGQINFGQAAFFGIGAYTTALMTTAGYSFWLALPSSGLMAAACSILLGLPTLRLRTYYLAMATIGFGEIVSLILIHWQSVTNGTSGIRGIPPINVFGFTLTSHSHYYFFLIATVLILVVVARRIRDSHFGRGMMATRDSEIAAELSGINTFSSKIVALVLAAFYAGMAGSIQACYSNYVSPDQFSGQQAILFFTMLIVGGSGSIGGSIIGAFVLTFLPEFLRFMQNWYMVFYGVGIIVSIILMPRGLVGVAEQASFLVQRRYKLIFRKSSLV